MLIGLNALKTVDREKAPVLDAWFQGDEHPVVSVAKTFLSAVQIHNSIKGLAKEHTPVPSLPRHAPAVAKTPAPATTSSPYQAISTILEPGSRSSRWLSHYGLMDQFASSDCFVDMSMNPDGGMSAVLRSPEGYRRTVVCRPDGSSAQRITGPHGQELVRFNKNGDPVTVGEKQDSSLAIA